MRARLSSLEVLGLLTLVLVTTKTADAVTCQGTRPGEGYEGQRSYREFDVTQDQCAGGATAFSFLGAVYDSDIEVNAWYIKVPNFNGSPICRLLGDADVEVKVDSAKYPKGVVPPGTAFKVKNKYWMEHAGGSHTNSLESTSWDCVGGPPMKAFADHRSGFDTQNELFVFENTDTALGLHVADFKFVRSEMYYDEDFDTSVTWGGTHPDFPFGGVDVTAGSSLTPLDVAGEGRYIYFMLEVTDLGNHVFTLYGREDTEYEPEPSVQSRVLRYDGTTGAFMGALPRAGLVEGEDVVFDTEGRLYVSCGATNQVLRYNAAGGFDRVFVADGDDGPDEPKGLAFGPADGYLYVSSGATNEVLRYDGTTGAFFDVFVAAGGELAGPEGLAFVSGDKLCVSSEHTDQVLRYNTDGSFDITFDPENLGGLDEPGHLVFGDDGKLYVSSVATGEVLRYLDNPTGAFEIAFVPGGAELVEPKGLDFGPDDWLYVSSGATNEVLRYNASGGFEGIFVAAGDGGLEEPEGLAFGPKDKLYVVSVAVDRIPTVSEWGLMVLALLVLTAGTVVIGRRRRAAAA